MTFRKVLPLFLAFALLFSACQNSSTETGKEIVDVTQDKLAFSAETTDEEGSSTTKQQQSTTGKRNTTSLTTAASTAKLPDTSKQSLSVTTPPSTNSTTAAKGPSTTPQPSLPSCATAEYQVTIPTNWNTAANAPNVAQFHCKAFTSDPFPAALECDCTLSLTITAISNTTGADVLQDLQASSASGYNETPGAISTVVEGQWLLNQVQTGEDNPTQTAASYIHVIESNGKVAVIEATEFHDFGGPDSFADRKAAADQLAVSLTIL